MNASNNRIIPRYNFSELPSQWDAGQKCKMMWCFVLSRSPGREIQKLTIIHAVIAESMYVLAGILR